MEEETAEVAPEESAPVEATEPAAERSLDDIIAAAEALPDDGATEPEAAAETAKTEEEAPAAPKPLPEVAPKIKPKSAAERIAMRHAREAEQAKLRPVEEQLATQRAELEAERRQIADREAKFRSLTAQGKNDEALKVLNMPTLAEMTRAQLKRAGAIQELDPAIAKELAEVRELRAQQKQEQERHQAQLLEQQRQAEIEQDIKDIADDISSSGYEGAEAMAAMPKFSQHVYAQLNNDPSLDLGTAIAHVNQQFRAVYNDLSKLFAPAQAGTPENPAQAGASSVSSRGSKAPVSIPQSGAATPRVTRKPTGDYVDPHSREFDDIIAQALRQAQ